MGGFSLVELMLSLSLGLALSGVMLQGLMAEGQNGARFSRLLRERAAQRRTLELVKQDLSHAISVSTTPDLEHHACSLAGRIPVLYLSTAEGAITYSIGDAPSQIWRGKVLMRCGPAYRLDGRLAKALQASNRVVIDALDPESRASNGCLQLFGVKDLGIVGLHQTSEPPFSVCNSPDKGLIALKIDQRIDYSGKYFKISAARLFPV
jgi:hypothetical protein